MASAVEHIEVFHQNSYILSPILENFFKHTESREKDILLSYLLFPLILYPESREKLKYANKNSSIYTLFSNQELLYGINDRVRDFKNNTNKCLLVLEQNGSIEITNSMSVNYKSSNLDSSLCDKDSLRAAKNLAILFNSHEIVEIYRKLGIKKL
ncbi:TPA: hypothetical protein KDY48_004638 [Vibrio parahaemolyticus]|nr:hypothetical protein [Vibrio parahaemolyticus]MDF4761144.1 DUF6521 family protein [Vibrio parahaemolyticus]HBC3445898.1 hypothetical protein [Vibrio parahaemolyticus]